jgi:hypothetical protein
MMQASLQVHLDKKQTILPMAAALTLLLVYICTPTYIGLLTIIFSLAGIVLSRTPLFLFLSFLTFSLGVAFDYYIRVSPYFYFYLKNGVSVEYLCFVSGLLYSFFLYFDRYTESPSLRYVSIDVNFPKVSRYYYCPLLLLVLFVSNFIINNTSNLLSGDFDAYDLQKYPLLEYMGIILAFLILSAKRNGKFYLYTAYVVGSGFIFLCLITSYRMVAIISALSMIFVSQNKKRINKVPLALVWLFSYVILTFISYFRIGIFDVNLENILGYQNGHLDNTFTGVIETALIYTGMYSKLGFDQVFAHLIGTILPLPNSLIPDSMLYIVEANRRYNMPGGGALAGFVIYFSYFLLIPFLSYVRFATKHANKNRFAAVMCLILFSTITRWWLYGPFVIFKFFGAFLILYGLNHVLLSCEHITWKLRFIKK